MRGSVTQLNKKLGCGFILGETVARRTSISLHLKESQSVPGIPPLSRIESARNPPARVELPVGHCLKGPEISLME